MLLARTLRDRYNDTTFTSHLLQVHSLRYRTTLHSSRNPRSLESQTHNQGLFCIGFLSLFLAGSLAPRMIPANKKDETNDKTEKNLIRTLSDDNEQKEKSEKEKTNT